MISKKDLFFMDKSTILTAVETVIFCQEIQLKIRKGFVDFKDVTTVGKHYFEELVFDTEAPEDVTKDFKDRGGFSYPIVYKVDPSEKAPDDVVYVEVLGTYVQANFDKDGQFIDVEVNFPVGKDLIITADNMYFVKP